VAQQWFYKLADGQSVGPLSSVELKRLADSGQISTNTPVKQAAGERWVPASRVTGLFQTARSVSARGVPPPLPPVEPVVVPPAPVIPPPGGDIRRQAGISVNRWLAISTVGVAAIVSIVLIIVFLNRGDKTPPTEKDIVVEKPADELPKPTADVPKASPVTTAKNDQPHSEKSVETLVTSAPVKPATKNTERNVAAVAPAAVTHPQFDEGDAAAQKRKKEAAEEAQAIAETRKAEEAKQAELNSLNERISAAKADYKQLEQDAIVAAAKRGDAFTQAAAAETAAGKAAAQIADLQPRIDRLTADLNARSSSEVSRRDQMMRRATAIAQQDALKQQYGNLEAKYKELDSNARDLKSQLDSLLAKKASRSLELRRMEIQYDLLRRGPSAESMKDVAAASAWRGVKKGMKTADVEGLLGTPTKTESQARNPDFASSVHGGIVWQYKYQEAGTTVGIIGTIHFITGKVVDWELPPWACVN
jgi:hypothetical protein